VPQPVVGRDQARICLRTQAASRRRAIPRSSVHACTQRDTSEHATRSAFSRRLRVTRSIRTAYAPAYPHGGARQAGRASSSPGAAASRAATGLRASGTRASHWEGAARARDSGAANRRTKRMGGTDGWDYSGSAVNGGSGRTSEPKTGSSCASAQKHRLARQQPEHRQQYQTSGRAKVGQELRRRLGWRAADTILACAGGRRHFFELKTARRCALAAKAAPSRQLNQASFRIKALSACGHRILALRALACTHKRAISRVYYALRELYLNGARIARCLRFLCGCTLHGGEYLPRIGGALARRARRRS